MEWEKMSQEAAERLEKLVAPFECRKKRMFGHESYFVGDHMFAGVYGDRIFIRLSKKDVAEFLEIEGAKNFEPVAGRPMREYVVVPEAILEDPGAIDGWLKRSYGYVAGLPPKKTKK